MSASQEGVGSTKKGTGLPGYPAQKNVALDDTARMILDHFDNRDRQELVKAIEDGRANLMAMLAKWRDEWPLLRDHVRKAWGTEEQFLEGTARDYLKEVLLILRDGPYPKGKK